MKEFFMYLIDHDRKQFTIIGPLNHDAEINERIVAEQEKGRHLTSVASVQIAESGTESAIANYKKQTSFEFATEGQIWKSER